MYLRNIFIENMGSIEKMNILEKDMFLSNGNPKPIVLVGKNGSGKTMTLSSIADALMEFGNKLFQDVLPSDGKFGHKYYKILGGRNIKIGSEYGFTYLHFLEKNNEDKKYEYIEKVGNLSVEVCVEKTNNLFDLRDRWKENDNHKKITRVSKDQDSLLKESFEQSSYVFFPSDGFEYPHWFNKDTFQDEELIEHVKFNGQLDKPIVARRSMEETKRWILDICVDSRADVIKNGDTYITKQNLFFY